MRSRFVVFSLSFVILAAAPVQAADTSQFEIVNHKFQLYLGGFFPEVDSKVSINGEVLPPGPGLDFENVFGLEDSKTVLWGGARWRISRRNMLEFEFVNLNRDGSTGVVTDPIQIEDSIIQAGAEVDSTFDTTVARLTYGFSLVRNDRMDIQLKAGLHLADVSTTISATGAVCVDGEVPPNCSFFATTPEVVSESITAPLPHFGGSFVYGITPSVAMRLQIIGFAIELDSVDGSMVELDADFVWTPWKNFGVGAGVRYFDVDIEGKGSDLNGQFEFEYFGPTVYAIAAF